MRIALTGATGYVGQFVLRAAVAQGHDVTILGRRPLALTGPVRFQQWSLGQPADLRGFDSIVHAALSHVPGKYRGGEGNDPATFLHQNVDGSLRLFQDAAREGLRSALFLSSRAVFDAYPAGTLLTEALIPRPTSLYGMAKLQVEDALLDLASDRFCPIILRATGVYGPAAAPARNKWAGLFADFLDGKPIAPRIATEVHGDDLARAILLLLETAAGPARATWGEKAPNTEPTRPAGRRGIVAHISDIVLDRHDLLAGVRDLAGRPQLTLPTRSDPSGVSLLECTTLHQLGWHGGGLPLLRETLPALMP